MRIITSAHELRTSLKNYQPQGLSIGVVTTMGALHDGHLSLVRRSRKENHVTVMTLFVNPTQFGPNEDFERYPRDLEKDQILAEKAKVDVLFVPPVSEIYPTGFSTVIEETELSKYFCGPFRPNHFRGVCTVVYRLFQLVRPDRAYFGQKDAQQLRILEKMVSDLGLPIEVIACPTIREADGLALSSRNSYLSEEDRTIASQIYRALVYASEEFKKGERNSQTLVDLVKNMYASETRIQPQYVELRRWRDFYESSRIEEKSLFAVAAYLGKTRLIDNVILDPAQTGPTT